MRSAGVMLGVVLATACASTSAPKSTGGTTTTTTTTQKSTPVRDEMATGKISSISGKTLTLEPYEGGEARQFVLGKEVPVFFGDDSKSTDMLTPGTDVRVYYRQDAAGTGDVVALEVLTGDDAQMLREETEPAVPEEKVEPAAPTTTEPEPIMPEEPEPSDSLYGP